MSGRAGRASALPGAAAGLGALRGPLLSAADDVLVLALVLRLFPARQSHRQLRSTHCRQEYPTLLQYKISFE